MDEKKLKEENYVFRNKIDLLIARVEALEKIIDDQNRELFYFTEKFNEAS